MKRLPHKRSRLGHAESPQPVSPVNIWWAVALFLIPILAYIPAMQSGFIWDDDKFLTDNPLIKASDGLYNFWFSRLAPDYFPLTSSMLWLEWRLFHMDATGYHVVNVLLHAVTAVLLWRVLNRLNVSTAGVAALLFALHPVCVESVAWITERKNTLSMLLVMGSLLLYLKSETEIRRRWYAASVWCFLLALLAKTSVVMLPVILLLVAWWQRGNITAKDILRTFPFFVLSAFLGLLTLYFQYEVSIGEETIRKDGALSRLAIAGWAFWFYIYKALLPVRLCFVYPTPGWASNPVIRFIPLMAAALIFALLWFGQHSSRWKSAREIRTMLFTLSGYGISVLPVLGFFDIYYMKYALVADHWQYVALPFVIATVTGGMNRLLHALSIPVRGAVAGAAACIFFALTWHEQGAYKNEETLWLNTIEKNPSAWLALTSLGARMEKQNNYDQALIYYERSLQAKSDQPDARNGVGNVLLARGLPEDAIAQYQMAVKENPRYANAYNNLGHAYQHIGARKEAIDHFNKALVIKPWFAIAHNNLAGVLAEEGRNQEAESHYNQAFQVDPDYAEARMNLANLLAQTGRMDEAFQQYEKAIRQQPDNATLFYNRANAYEASGKFLEARNDYLRALELQPNYLDADRNLKELDARFK